MKRKSLEDNLRNVKNFYQTALELRENHNGRNREFDGVGIY